MRARPQRGATGDRRRERCADTTNRRWGRDERGEGQAQEWGEAILQVLHRRALERRHRHWGLEPVLVARADARGVHARHLQRYSARSCEPEQLRVEYVVDL